MLPGLRSTAPLERKKASATESHQSKSVVAHNDAILEKQFRDVAQAQWKLEYWRVPQPMLAPRKRWRMWCLQFFVKSSFYTPPSNPTLPDIASPVPADKLQYGKPDHYPS
jgi:hypothetical protein